MDLKYYDYDADGNGQWISLKATDPTTTDSAEIQSEIANNDSTFTTPKYIINNLVEKKDGNFVKYYDGTILNEKIVLGEEEEGTGTGKKEFVSKIKLNDDENGTITLTPIYREIVKSTESTPSGNIVSNISFNDSGNLEVTKGKLSDNLLNLISSGPTPPGNNTKGFFYLQIEESSGSDASA